MSTRAWLTLTMSFVLSLLVAGGVAWWVHQPERWPRSALLSPLFVSSSPPCGPQLFPRPVPEGRYRPGYGGPWKGKPIFTRPSTVWQVGRVLATEIFFFLAGAVLVVLAPQRVGRTVRAFYGRGGRWQALIMGLVGVGFTLAMGILAGFSAFGLFVLLWLPALFGLLWGTGIVIVALWLGRAVRVWVHVPDEHWPLELALGVTVLIAVAALPVVGWIALALVGTWGIGAVFLTRFGSEKGWNLPSKL